MYTQVKPTVTISNTPKGILDYLVRLTENTIGTQMDISGVVIVGEVKKSEAKGLLIRPEHISQLQSWISEETDAGPRIIIHLTVVKVEKWLFGPEMAKQVKIAYAYPKEIIDEGSDFIPIFTVKDRGLLFLQKVSPDVPYAPYIPQRSYQLAQYEKGVRNFLVTDYDDKGQPFMLDETAKVNETIAAVQWYIALPHEKPEALYQALIKAVDNVNPRIFSHAIRTLAKQGDSRTALVFKEKLKNAKEDLQVQLMLGLWVLGEQEAARHILEGLFQVHDKYTWLTRWDVKPSLAGKGHSVNTLYGPDPSGFKGE